MEIATYHIDSFADKLFSGNPAAICILPTWLTDKELQQIAAENNLPATAFLVEENNQFKTRWFTPEYEIDLCGHGLLATAYVVFNELKKSADKIDLYHPKQGKLIVTRDKEWLTLDFPSKAIEPIATPELLIKGFNVIPQAVYQFENERCLAIFSSEHEIKSLKPDQQILKQLPHRGVIVTAKGTEVDFVSRVFYPHKTMFEDAMTGSSYCLLVPYWVEQLNKTKFNARQLSARGGQVVCEYKDGRIMISGQAILFKRGTIFYS